MRAGVMNGGRTVTTETCLYAEDYAFRVADTHVSAADLQKVQVGGMPAYALLLIHGLTHEKEHAVPQ